jgi:putative N6-adenine-specific DNA methylase
MPEFYAIAPRGLKEALRQEFHELRFKRIKNVASGITFEGSWTDCYRANLQSRIANRILKPLLEFVAYEPDELYRHVLRHDFTKYIEPHQTLRVEASITESKLRDQRFVALKVKDAIVDQFRDKFGNRPSINKDNADLSIHVYASKNQFYIYLDTSGAPLLQRGYRKKTGHAPIKESLAAGLLYLSKWDKKTPIVDPFCGSGTILIEAALLASQIAPGSLRKHFAFQNLKNFDNQGFNAVVEAIVSKELADVDVKFYGFDYDPEAIKSARANAKRAGVDHLIEFKVKEVSKLTPPVNQGIIITNPPYGVRLSDHKMLEWVFRDFSHALKENFSGWDVWVLSASQEQSSSLGLKSSQKFQVFNGNIECRFLNYHIKKGSYSTRVYRKF